MGWRPATSMRRFRPPSAARPREDLYEEGSDRHFPLVVRLAPRYRQNIETISGLTIAVQDPAQQQRYIPHQIQRSRARSGQHDALNAVPVSKSAKTPPIIAIGMTAMVSAAIGFIALFGIAVMEGIILLSYFNQLIEGGVGREAAITQACQIRFRPVMMTCIAACVGLLPAALSTAIGAQVQRPLALVVVGGILLTPILVLIILPVAQGPISLLLNGFSSHLLDHIRSSSPRKHVELATLAAMSNTVLVAQTSKEWSQCSGSEGPIVDVIISGCSAVIQATRPQPIQRAIGRRLAIRST
jgi:hypothetical protein